MSFVWRSTVHKGLFSTGSRKQKQNCVYKRPPMILVIKNIFISKLLCVLRLVNSRLYSNVPGQLKFAAIFIAKMFCELLSRVLDCYSKWKFKTFFYCKLCIWMISNSLVLLLTCFRNLKVFCTKRNCSQTGQTHSRDMKISH